MKILECGQTSGQRFSEKSGQEGLPHGKEVMAGA